MLVNRTDGYKKSERSSVSGRGLRGGRGGGKLPGGKAAFRRAAPFIHAATDPARRIGWHIPPAQPLSGWFRSPRRTVRSCFLGWAGHLRARALTGRESLH